MRGGVRPPAWRFHDVVSYLGPRPEQAATYLADLDFNIRLIRFHTFLGVLQR